MNRAPLLTSPASSVKPLAKRCLSVLVAQCAAAGWVRQLSTVVGLAGTKPTEKLPVKGNYIHPCVIKKHKTLIHARDLAARNPDFYTELQAYAKAEGYVLLADRRQQDSPVANERRSGLLPVLLLSVGLSSVAAADIHHHSSAEPVQNTLALFNAADSRNNITITAHASLGADSSTAVTKSSNNELAAVVNATLANEILGVLQQHYQASKNDPDYIGQDLQAMANYFSRYPQAVELLLSLNNHNWQLAYSKDTFETQVRGSQIQVRSVKVSFDSRAAAQLNSHRSCLQSDQRGACVASPADALLHELLHARSALLESKTFIAQGGMNSVLYPYEHESAVIQNENALYQAMSSVDGAFRPSRHSHQGKILASACVTCLQ